MKSTDQKTFHENMQPPSDITKQLQGNHILMYIGASLAAGLVAALMAVLLMVLLRVVAGVPTPVELFGDFVLKRLPAPRFVDMLVTFGSHAKTAPLGLALLGMIGLGSVLGVVYAAIVRIKLPTAGYRPQGHEWITAAVFALVMTAIAVGLFWNEIGQNFLGLPIEWAMFVTILSLLAEFGLYGLTLCLVYRFILPKQPVAGASTLALGRRQLLARVGATVVGVGAAAGTVGLIQDFLSNYASYDGMFTNAHNGFTSPITPNSEHYVVTQNAVDPTPQLNVWRLEVTGLVGKSGTYTYEEVQNLPSTSRAITLECIANGVGSHLISTAIWQGVTLRTLLSLHGGAQSTARYVAFYSVDGYVVSLPLDEVLAVDALLAWRMNGSELPNRHGFPMRVLIPGRYGEENPKWLTRVELTDHFVDGLYSDQGWYNGPLHTWTRIDRPIGRLPLGQTIDVGGVAFAGNRGISKVEVSVDNGISWNEAKLNPPLSSDSWVLWSWQWSPSQAGKYMIVARSTDGTGQVQTSQAQGTVPNGATGYARDTVDVR